MQKIPLIAVLVLALAPLAAFSKDKSSSIEDAIRDEVSDELDYDKKKGKGRPDNPGEHGRDNAEQKQRDNPGKGSKDDNSWEDEIREKFEDDEDKNDKNDKGDKNKAKDKNKKK